MEKSVNTLSKEEKADIFEYVNNVHLHLKGHEKKATKQKFVHTWKQNKLIGCYELFMALYRSQEVYDNDNEWFKKYLNEQCETEEDYKHKKISLAKHRRITARRQEEIEELEQQLKEIEEAEGYMKEEEHDEIVRDLKKSLKADHQVELEAEQRKSHHLSLEAEKYKSRLETANSQLAYYKKLCEDLEKELKD